VDGEDVNGGVEHVFGPRSTTAIGSLPHRDPVGAATCAFAATTLPCIPSLPRRSPAEGMVAQAVGSLPGVTLGQYGSISIDPSRFGSDIVVGADLRSESFGGLRAFLELAVRRDHRGPVKWQFIGPVTLGLSLRRAGAPSSVAFRLAVNAVRAHLDAIATVVACRLPHSRQIVLVDEPSFGSLMTSSFPIAPDVAIDLVSEAMSVLEHRAVVGLHCCDRADIPSLLATGPRLLSLPVTSAVPDAAGYLQRYLDRGGAGGSPRHRAQRSAPGATAAVGPSPAGTGCRHDRSSAGRRRRGAPAPTSPPTRGRWRRRVRSGSSTSSATRTRVRRRARSGGCGAAGRRRRWRWRRGGHGRR